MQPTLSVVIPTHHRARTLAQMIGPLLADEAVTEVVIVVDGLDARTLAVLEAVPNVQRRLRWSVLEPNQGLVRAKSNGITLARGDIVLMLDDDVRLPAGWPQDMSRISSSGITWSWWDPCMWTSDYAVACLTGSWPATTRAYATDVAGYVSNPEESSTVCGASNVSMPRRI
ncbi:MAG: glycosyltransferase [Micrococcales bacterium]|nr:glycosyltransferase [Micrococcales bacterium]